MAELTSRDRLQPALLDRLTDDHPRIQLESREQRVVSMRKLREGVLRDLSCLLNSRPLYVPDMPLYAHIEGSVLNHGLSDFTGKVLSGTRPDEIADAIATCVRRFEPRILPHSLRVSPLTQDSPQRSHVLVFLIEGDLWAQPYPEHLYVKTELDLEDGEALLISGGIVEDVPE